MTVITENHLIFVFPEHWEAAKYDDWTYYRKQFQNTFGGAKGVDIVAISPPPSEVLWLIEIKDYRNSNHGLPSQLPETIARKVRDTLAGLVAAKFNADDVTEKRFAEKALKMKDIRLIFHLEQPRKHSKLFPKAIKHETIHLKLRQLLKSVDPRLKVLSMGTTAASVDWRVISVPEDREKQPNSLY